MFSSSVSWKNYWRIQQGKREVLKQYYADVWVFRARVSYSSFCPKSTAIAYNVGMRSITNTFWRTRIWYIFCGVPCIAFYYIFWFHVWVKSKSIKAQIEIELYIISSYIIWNSQISLYPLYDTTWDYWIIWSNYLQNCNDILDIEYINIWQYIIIKNLYLYILVGKRTSVMCI